MADAVRSAPFVIAGGADCLVRHAEGRDQFVVLEGMANADRPWGFVLVQSAQIEVASGIDGEIFERLELAGGGIDGESFRDGPEIERQRTKQGDGFSIRIEMDVAIADLVIRSNRAADDLAGAMLPVEAARLHAMADGGVERAAGLRRDHKCEAHGFIEDRAGGDEDAGLGGELHELALMIETGTVPFDFVKPSERAGDGGV